MTRWIIAFLFASLGLTSTCRADEPDSKVSGLIKDMSLEEKVGQMTQVTLEVVSKSGPNGIITPHELDMEKLRDAVVKHHVGSILNVGTSAHSIEHWHEIITAIQDVATRETRLHIPVLYGIDAIHGANYTAGATLFPQAIAMAATWNPGLMKENGEITAYEVRASGIPWNFSPVLDVGRQPLWPRLWETFGEDPFLVSTMGAAYLKGLEGEDNDISRNDKVAGCMKHYLGYGMPLTGKDRTPAWIPDRQLREIFVPSFKAAIDAGAHTIMVNSAHINGVPVHASYYYLTELLRNELDFKGLTVTDWYDIINLYERDRVVASNEEAVRMAVMAGIDMSMVPFDFSFYELLIKLVNEGTVPMARIDESVARILSLKFELGLFERPFPDPTLKSKFACQAFTNTNIQAAHEAVTLLKNNNSVLPLPMDKKILVTGPNADRLSVLNGGWTITWSGDREDLYPGDKKTILQAIREKIGEGGVVYAQGTKFNEEIDIAAAVAAARTSDVIIACLGEDTYCETSGNITDLTLPEVQLRLVEALAETGRTIVLVLVEGRPRIISRIVDDVDAVVMAYLPGIEGGPAIADILFGDYNPCGKLPITYPRHVNDFTLYDHTYSETHGEHCRYNPQWPFGYGLSYTTFEYSDIRIDKEKIGKGDVLTCRITVKNTGVRPGKEIVQLYLSDLVASIIPPVKRLKGFTNLDLAPGEAKSVFFKITEKDLAFIGLENKPVVEPGQFKLTIGTQEETFIYE